MYIQWDGWIHRHNEWRKGMTHKMKTKSFHSTFLQSPQQGAAEWCYCYKSLLVGEIKEMFHLPDTGPAITINMCAYFSQPILFP